MMPDEYLDGLRAEDRAAFWRRQLNANGGRGLLVQTVGDNLVGFAAFGPAGGEPGVGELHALNVDPDYWGHGLGRSLLQATQAELAAWGFTDLVLWVLPENQRARKLYEAEGWTADGTVEDREILDVKVTDIRYRRTLAE
jgi:GNAT superfamily N-acetyltransferase